MIRENNYDPITNPIKDPIKDTLVPLRNNFIANGSLRWRTSVCLNMLHWQMGKNSGNLNGVCRYVRTIVLLFIVLGMVYTFACPIITRTEIAYIICRFSHLHWD